MFIKAVFIQVEVNVKQNFKILIKKELIKKAGKTVELAEIKDLEVDLNRNFFMFTFASNCPLDPINSKLFWFQRTKSAGSFGAVSVFETVFFLVNNYVLVCVFNIYRRF